MFSSFLSLYEPYFVQLNQARQSAFSSVGFYDEIKTKLTKYAWINTRLNAKKNKEEENFLEDSSIAQISTLIEQGIDQGIILQACLQMLEKQPLVYKTQWLNALYFSSACQPFAKALILESQTWSLLSDAVSDAEILGLRQLDSKHNLIDNTEAQSALSWLNSPLDVNTPSREIVRIYTAMSELGLFNSVFMPLLLWLLSPEQVNTVCNYASEHDSDNDTLLLLAKSGIVKHTLLINSAIAKIESPELIITQLRMNLGIQLDQLVPYEIQLEASKGDAKALSEFQVQLQHNWSKFSPGSTADIYIGGVELSPSINAIAQIAFDQTTHFQYQLLLKYYQRHPLINESKVA